MLDITPNSKTVRAKAEYDSRVIYRQIRSGILNGLLPAGSRLPTERELSLRFGAARNTVRNTMERLASEGLIVRQVGRGTYVAEHPEPAGHSEEEYTLSELLEARLLFEPHLPDLVVERATPGDLAEMRACLEAMRDASTWEAFKEAKYALHVAIARASHNRFIVAIFEQILASRRRAGWSRPGGHPGPLSAIREAAYRENAEIVDALKAGDSRAAQDAIRSYLLRTLSATGTF